MSRLPIDLLEYDWQRELAGSTLGERLRCWRTREAALTPFSSPTGLLSFLRRSSAGEREDAVLRALLRCARSDRVAARLVLQRLLPGLKRRAGRVLSCAGEREELWSLLLAAAWERIRTYPVERVPRHVAANLLLSSVRDACELLTEDRTLRACAVPNPCGGVLFAGPEPQDRWPAFGLDGLLADAVKAGAVTAEEAELIASTRIDRVPLVRSATAMGVSYDALRVRRRRAERRLALHLGVRDVRFGGSKPPLCRARVAGGGPAGQAGANDHSEPLKEVNTGP
jgi:hypothetical protein